MKNKGFFTKKCAIIILFIGLLLGITTIIMVFFNFENKDYINNNENNIVSNKRTKEDIKNDISNLKEQINKLNEEKEQLINERNEIFKNEGFSDKYNEKTEEIINKGKEIFYLEEQLDKYEDELFFMDDEFNNISNNKIHIFENKLFNPLNLSFKTKMLILGFFIIFFTLLSYLCIIHGYRRKQLIIKKLK